jgi:hypothetical protein
VGQSQFELLLHDLFTNPCLKEVRMLPLVAIWVIWITLNSCIFEDKHHPPFQVTRQVLGILSHYKGISGSLKSHVIGSMEINKCIPWGFFDEAS